MKILAVALAIALTPSVASAAGWFLVLNNAFQGIVVVIPETYPAKSQCDRAGRVWAAGDEDNEYRCVPAPGR